VKSTKSKKSEIKKLVRVQVDEWVDSLGDAVTVEYVCLVIDKALRLCTTILDVNEVFEKDNLAKR